MNASNETSGALQRVLFALFALSGFCGLIYESIWAYYLKLFVGHAAYAQTVVLVVFIGGLAIGAWIAGRFASRVGNPLLTYAIVEAIVGIFALSFQWIFTTATDWAYASLIPAMCSADGVCAPQWILAGLLILPQSILLGPGPHGAIFEQLGNQDIGMGLSQPRLDPRLVDQLAASARVDLAA